MILSFHCNQSKNKSRGRNRILNKASWCTDLPGEIRTGCQTEKYLPWSESDTHVSCGGECEANGVSDGARRVLASKIVARDWRLTCKGGWKPIVHATWQSVTASDGSTETQQKTPFSESRTNAQRASLPERRFPVQFEPLTWKCLWRSWGRPPLLAVAVSNPSGQQIEVRTKSYPKGWRRLEGREGALFSY